MTAVASTEMSLVAMERLHEFVDLTPEASLSRPIDPRPSTNSSKAGAAAAATTALTQPGSYGDDHGSITSLLARGDLEMGEAEESWPYLGAVEFRDVTMSYRPGLPPVLKDLSFYVEPGSRVGIVGRTGSGQQHRVNELILRNSRDHHRLDLFTQCILIHTMYTISNLRREKFTSRGSVSACGA